MSDTASMISEDDSEVGIAMDCGGYSTRIGFMGSDYPRECRSVVGRAEAETMIGGLGGAVGGYVGEQALNRQNVLKLVEPLVGMIKDWDAVEQIWSHCFYDQLRAATEDQPILMSVKPKCNNHQKEGITERMFEKYNFPGCYIASDAALAIYETGSMDGIVVDLGYQESTVTYVYEGFSVPRLSRRTRICSSSIDSRLSALMQVRLNISAKDARVQAEYLKHTYSQVLPSVDEYTEILANMEDTKLKLADGKQVDLKRDLLTLSEGIFQPALLNSTESSLPKLIQQVVNKIDPELKKEAKQNILLIGGGSLVPGLPERLESEVKSLLGQDIKLICPADRQHVVWSGASVLGTLSHFQNAYITKTEYSEYGPYCARRKCLI